MLQRNDLTRMFCACLTIENSRDTASFSALHRVSTRSAGVPWWGFSNTATRGYLAVDFFALLFLNPLSEDMLPCTDEVCFSHVSRSPATSASMSQTGLHYNHTGPVVPVDKWTHEICTDDGSDSWSDAGTYRRPLSYSMTIEPQSCQMVDLTALHEDVSSSEIQLSVGMLEFG